MRLLIVGGLDGQLSVASKIALDRGAKVLHSASLDEAVTILRGGRGAGYLGGRLEQGRVVARLAEGAHHIALLLKVVQVVADGDGGDAEEHAQRLHPHLVGLARQLHDLQPALE